MIFSNFLGFNGVFAVEPFTAGDLKVKVSNGFAQTGHTGELIKVKVVFGTKDQSIAAGDYVYFKSDTVKAPWAREVFEIEGQKFVLAQESAIVAVYKA